MRIVAGRLGGRRLVAPKGQGTRPTTDRVREAVFSLGEVRRRVEGARVADLFAGTGALGLEALSRGAARVEFYEASGKALRALSQNIEALGVAEEVQVHRGRLPRAMGPGPALDLVFMDPPYGTGAWAAALRAVLTAGRLAAGGLIVLEEAKGIEGKVEAWEALGLRQVDARRYGDTTILLLSEPSGH